MARIKNPSLRIGLTTIVLMAALAMSISKLTGGGAAGPEVSFGGSGSFQLGGTVEALNQAGLYLSPEMQASQVSNNRFVEGRNCYLDQEGVTACGAVDLMNASTEHRPAGKCTVSRIMVKRVNSAGTETGIQMTLDGVPLFGRSAQELMGELGEPEAGDSLLDAIKPNLHYVYEDKGKTYHLWIYFEEGREQPSRVELEMYDPDIEIITR